jgi:hypothetical protein
MEFCLTLDGPWILVTSSGFRIISQDEETLLPERAHVDSWTLEEYKEAISTKSSHALPSQQKHYNALAQ